MARQGKLARLPHLLRLQVNLRLLDGEPASKILPWLNSQVDAIRVWEEFFEGVPCSPQNLSEWKLGGYKEWRKERERLENLKELATYATDVVEATGGKLADGAAAIASGHLLEVLENIGNLAVTGGSEDADEDPNKGLAAIAGAIKKMQDGERKKEDSRRKDKTLELQEKRHALSEKQLRLAEDKFQRLTVEKFMEFAKSPDAQAILNSNSKQSVKMADLRKLMFGERKEVA